MNSFALAFLMVVFAVLAAFLLDFLAWRALYIFDAIRGLFTANYEEDEDQIRDDETLEDFEVRMTAKYGPLK